MDELLPALDVRLAWGRELAAVLRAALDGGIAPVRLDIAPLEHTMHALEVHIDGWTESLVLSAEPVGFSRDGRFPLRLGTFDDAQRDAVSKLLARCAGQPSIHPADPFEGREIADGKYRLDRLLGEGAVGRVYHGMHTSLARAVAVKVLHPFFQNSADFIARFHHEALAASRLDHANVTRVLDFGQEDDGTLYLVMEYLEGSHLQSILDREGPLEPGRAVRLMMQVCGALSIAHEAGIVHRDIKPENIIVVAGRSDDGSPTEIVKVCDFGIAQLQGEGRPGTAGQICGSPAYMSPEQGRGEFLDARSDVYSCGITLHQLLTGEVPFDEADIPLLLQKHATEAPRRPSELRPEIGAKLDRVVLKCLAKEREDRPQSARELRAALQSAIGAERVEPTLELEEFVSLTDPRSGFSRLLEALAHLVLRDAPIEPRAVVDAATTVLRYCGELSLTIDHERGELLVLTGAGEVHRIAELFAGAELPDYVTLLAAHLFEADVVALTLRAGIDEASLAALHPLVPATAARPARPTTSVSLLLAADVLGKSRKLPPNVDLVLSKIAHDLRAVWQGSTVEPAAKRESRDRIFRDALRSVDATRDLLLVLAHGDLVEAVVGPALEGTFADRALAVLPVSRAIAVADVLLAEQTGTIGASLLRALAARLAHERTSDVEVVLRDLRARGLIDWSELPDETRFWLRGSEEAPRLARDPAGVCEAMSSLDDVMLSYELGWLRNALPLVVRRGNAAAGRAVHNYLVKLRRDAATPERAAAIGEALAVYDRPEVLRALAEILLFGDAPQREPARLLLAGIEGGADAIVRVASNVRPNKVPHPASSSMRIKR